MGWPQYTYLALTLLGAGLVLAKDGEPKGNYSFLTTLICDGFVLWLLWAGGFFA